MTISVWRYSHLALAVSSFLLLTLAAVTGIILSFEPVSTNLQPYRVEGFNEITLAETLPVIREKYPEITELSVNPQGFVQIKGSGNDGKELLVYIDPRTAKTLGVPVKQSEFFQWVTALHRSLFLHEAGRFFIGLTAFLLLLITVSGTMLIIQRQRGVKRFFTKIARDGFAQYYHVVLGRLSLIPIFVIAISGTYLSLARFELINVSKESPKVDFDAIKSEPERKPTEFAIFKNTRLSEVETVEFPFSEDVEDYYTLKLNNAEVVVNQVTGDILGKTDYPKAVTLTNLSLDLHTGRASSIWAIILAIASANILFFIYSGFAITIKRRANRTKNKYKATESEYIILVGSENGTTFGFAKAVHGQLLKAGKKSYITELNNYTVFSKAKQLIVVAATYGLGDPPTNASKFGKLLEENPQIQPVQFSVLGFGSHVYPDFCKFAYEVHHLLSLQSWAIALTDIHTVNDRSPEEFSLWAEAWSQQSGIPVTVLPELYSAKATRLETLAVVSNKPEEVMPGGTFTINLQPRKRLRVTSGDLLAIYPENDYRERLYSIGVINKEISLTIKLHEGGIGSGFLSKLKNGQKVRAKIIKNKHFHFPKSAPEVIMISNGTGIAPFLGMISENAKHVPCHLYCGFRSGTSYETYQSFLEEHKAANKVLALNTAFSRDGAKQYVSDLIERDAEMIADVLIRKGVVMICGSLAMQKDVVELLETICIARTGNGVSHFQSHDQILTDCY
ncbi:MAG: FAD-binding oxidoreductase [Pedobacter sp.]|nr:MAG: FAD-binding oxidoreductase [Pedobacter sp.]